MIDRRSIIPAFTWSKEVRFSESFIVSFKRFLPLCLLVILPLAGLCCHQLFGYLRVEAWPYGLILYHLERCFLLVLPIVLLLYKKPNGVAVFIALVLLAVAINFNFLFAAISLWFFVLAVFSRRLRLVILPCSFGVALICLPIFLFTLFGYQGEYEEFEAVKFEGSSAVEVRVAAVGNCGVTTGPGLFLELVRPVLPGIYLHKTILVFDKDVAQVRLVSANEQQVKYFVSSLDDGQNKLPELRSAVFGNAPVFQSGF